MNLFIALIAFAISSSTTASMPRLPIPSGQYLFAHRSAEHPNIVAIPVIVRIAGHHITVTCQVECDGFPKGLIDEGTLMWNKKSKEWVIGYSDSDRYANEVGGCSEGPTVVDLKNKVYWTC